MCTYMYMLLSDWLSWCILSVISSPYAVFEYYNVFITSCTCMSLIIHSMSILLVIIVVIIIIMWLSWNMIKLKWKITVYEEALDGLPHLLGLLSVQFHITFMHVPYDNKLLVSKPMWCMVKCQHFQWTQGLL